MEEASRVEPGESFLVLTTAFYMSHSGGMRPPIGGPMQMMPGPPHMMRHPRPMMMPARPGMMRPDR